LAGLAVYAGEPLAVVDLLALTGGDELQGGGRVTVVVSRQHAAGRGLLGLAVQEALHVFALSLDEIEAQERGPITGVVRTDDGDIEIVDPLRIGSSTPTVEGGLFFATDPKDPDGGA
jgi:chemotaxis signal transduction protein